MRGCKTCFFAKPLSDLNLLLYARLQEKLINLMDVAIIVIVGTAESINAISYSVDEAG